MYQELQIIEDGFDGPVVWGTEGNDLPLPVFAKGDVLDFPGSSDPYGDHDLFEPAREQEFAYRVLAVKHVLSPTGRGPECRHKLHVEKFKPAESEVNLRIADLELELEQASGKAEFLQHIIVQTGGLGAQAILSTLTDSIAAEMKSESAQGIEEADNAWMEAAIILQADDHLLAQTMRDELHGRVYSALKLLTAAKRTAVWIWCDDGDGLKDLVSSWDGGQWSKNGADFDPAKWANNMDEVERLAMNWLVSRLKDVDQEL